MVMIPYHKVKSLPHGTAIRFPRALPNTGIEAGDVGILHVEKLELPRRRGSFKNYIVEFDDGQTWELPPGLLVQVYREAPDVVERRQERYRKAGRGVRGLVTRLSSFYEQDEDPPRRLR